MLCVLCVLGGLERPQAGTVRVIGNDLASLSGDEPAAYGRETIGFVFQDFGLLGQLAALENVEPALTLGRVLARAEEVLGTELVVGEPRTFVDGDDVRVRGRWLRMQIVGVVAQEAPRS